MGQLGIDCQIEESMNQLSGNSKLMLLFLAAALTMTTSEVLERALASKLDKNIVVVELTLTDPVFPAKPPSQYQIVGYKDEENFPAGYSIFVRTPVCIDGKCHAVEVTLYFDALGYFTRLECPENKPLTKKEHELFTPEDYDKLDRILKDSDSPHRDHSLAFLSEATKGPAAVSPEVDGWSRATPATMREAVVQDAAYTSWVLWQWTNGPICDALRAETTKECTPDYLSHLLRHPDLDYVEFALEHVIKHAIRDERLVDAALQVLERGERSHVTLALQFLNNAIPRPAQRHARLVDCFSRMPQDRSPILLEYLASEQKLAEETLENLSGLLGQLPYYQVHLILNLLEKPGCATEVALDNVAGLLNSKNFFIARRAYEYLVKQNLRDELDRKVSDFQEKNQDRL